VRARGDFVKLGLEAPVDLDRVDVCGTVGEERRQDAEARPDLEDDVAGPEHGQALDHAQDVLVDEEVLSELVPRRDARSGHGSPNAAAAFSSICRSSAAGSSLRAVASTARVWTTFAGSFGRPRRDCGER